MKKNWLVGVLFFVSLVVWLCFLCLASTWAGDVTTSNFLLECPWNNLIIQDKNALVALGFTAGHDLLCFQPTGLTCDVGGIIQVTMPAYPYMNGTFTVEAFVDYFNVTGSGVYAVCGVSPAIGGWGYGSVPSQIAIVYTPPGPPPPPPDPCADCPPECLGTGGVTRFESGGQGLLAGFAGLLAGALFMFAILHWGT